MSKWSNVRARVEKLAALDEEFDVVGASEHKYILVPPLEKSAVEQFEAEHDVQLPADYRGFVLEVGSSGAGPGEGLLPLGTAWPLKQGALAKPFARNFDGMIPLCKAVDGGGYDALVVRGDSAVWRVNTNFIDDWYGPDGQLADFSFWYLGWLTQMEAALS